MAHHKPAQTIQLGRIRATIWANQNGESDLWFSVTVSRSYRDGNDWKDTTSFRRDDLPVLAKALDMAYEWIWARSQRPTAEVTEL
jgi:hypothetical protein